MQSLQSCVQHVATVVGRKLRLQSCFGPIHSRYRSRPTRSCSRSACGAMQFFGVNCSGINTKLQGSCTKVVDAADIRDNAVASCTLYTGIFGLIVLFYELIATQSAVEERQYATLLSSYVLIVYAAKVDAVLSAQSEMQRCLVRAQATHGDTAVQKELTRLEGLGVRKIRLAQKPRKR